MSSETIRKDPCGCEVRMAYDERENIAIAYLKPCKEHE